MRSFFIFVFLNTLNYFILTVDFRATAQANYFWSIVTNYVAAVLTMTILVRIVKAHTWTDCQGYAVGGVIGNILGIIFTQRVFGQ